MTHETLYIWEVCRSWVNLTLSISPRLINSYLLSCRQKVVGKATHHSSTGFHKKSLYWGLIKSACPCPLPGSSLKWKRCYRNTPAATLVHGKPGRSETAAPASAHSSPIEMLGLASCWYLMTFINICWHYRHLMTFINICYHYWHLLTFINIC